MDTAASEIARAALAGLKDDASVRLELAALAAQTSRHHHTNDEVESALNELLYSYRQRIDLDAIAGGSSFNAWVRSFCAASIPKIIANIARAKTWSRTQVVPDAQLELSASPKMPSETTPLPELVSLPVDSFFLARCEVAQNSELGLQVVAARQRGKPISCALDGAFANFGATVFNPAIGIVLATEAVKPLPKVRSAPILSWLQHITVLNYGSPHHWEPLTAQFYFHLQQVVSDGILFTYRPPIAVSKAQSLGQRWRQRADVVSEWGHPIGSTAEQLSDWIFTEVQAQKGVRNHANL